ncbi:hypothetical protein C0V70_06265 [Bacteriovorax stolpii]|uniref:Uncharacterized protein n=1 Tax=Bacteriovorax stolpii TaxID=960 RepID=A0A2K9NQD6_BACTC|nr:hypothetical protein [Bacteriovorax stolpii]AUN97721.1 hypothetical protein C0V70_06265 [Bacteriovorax stolpii]TDP51540.1 hypothetical protein C8D79_2984 [Bacteriovorax stolpii]
MKKTTLHSFSIVLFSFLFSLHLSAADNGDLIEKDEKYQKANKEFELILKAAQDVGAAECKTDKGELPRSAYLWFNEGKRLLGNEERNYNLFNSEIARIQKKMQATGGSELQAESLLILSQIHTLEINFLNGRNGRIQARKDFMTEFKNAKISAQSEEKKWLKTFDTTVMEEGLQSALSVAQKACDDKIKGCEEAKTQIQLSIAMAATYKGLYLRKNIPSKTANEDLKNKELLLLTSVSMIPAPSDSNYDWKSPAMKVVTPMMEERQRLGVHCPESADSKSQKKAVQIAKIYEDKTKSDEVKAEEMKKVDVSLANALIGGGLSVADLKRIPEEWTRQNLLIAQGHDREPFFAEIETKVNALIAADQEKLALIQEKKGKVLKMIMALGDLTKYKIDIEAECGANPNPGISICPSNGNPLCDPDSPQSVKSREYGSCSYLATQYNDQLTQLSKASEELKNNPNVVAVEAHYLGTVGPIWRAKIKNADGTYSYKNIIENASQYGTDGFGNYAGFGGVQNDPQYAKPKNQEATPSTSSAPSGNSSSSSPATKTNKTTDSKTKAKKRKTVEVAGVTEELSVEDDKTYNKYYDQISKEEAKNRAKIPTYCGSSPCKNAVNGLAPKNKECEIADADAPKLKEYNLCVMAVNEHNFKLDAAINLSSYIRTHPDFVEVARSPETNLWMAKMKNTIKGVYYLPLNYTEN